MINTVSNVYLLASKIRILLYTNFFSNPEYQEELVSNMSDILNVDVCFDGSSMAIDGDDTESVETAIHDVLSDFVDRNITDILEVFSKEFAEYDEENIFSLLRHNICWLYDVTYANKFIIIRFQ